MNGCYRTIRELTTDECHWLPETIAAGKTVYRCHKPTYGCISPFGVAVTFDPEGDYPFFEVPRDSLEEAS